MAKRAFRKQSGSDTPRYPTLEQFDADRRTFLGQLGAALLGAAVTLSEMPGTMGNNGRKRREDPKKKGKPTGGQKKKNKKKKNKKKARLKRRKRPHVYLGLSTGNTARIDETD